MATDDTVLDRVNCPNCGAELDWRVTLTKMRDCGYCGSTVLRDGEQLRRLGESGDMLDAPCLFRLGAATRLGDTLWRPIGHLRFSYGPGWWDEFWCLGDDGKTAWISVDEGDIVEEIAVAPPSTAPRTGEMTVDLGAVIVIDDETYTASEVEEAVCIAVRGELPELIAVGETHRYVDFVSPYGGALTWETWRTENGEAQSAWYRGVWRSPWEAELVEAGA